MFILTAKTNLQKAIAKAKKVRCAVKSRGFGKYSEKGKPMLQPTNPMFFFNLKMQLKKSVIDHFV